MGEVGQTAARSPTPARPAAVTSPRVTQVPARDDPAPGPPPGPTAAARAAARVGAGRGRGGGEGWAAGAPGLEGPLPAHAGSQPRPNRREPARRTSPCPSQSTPGIALATG